MWDHSAYSKARTRWKHGQHQRTAGFVWFLNLGVCAVSLLSYFQYSGFKNYFHSTWLTKQIKVRLLWLERGGYPGSFRWCYLLKGTFPIFLAKFPNSASMQNKAQIRGECSKSTWLITGKKFFKKELFKKKTFKFQIGFNSPRTCQPDLLIEEIQLTVIYTDNATKIKFRNIVVFQCLVLRLKVNGWYTPAIETLEPTFTRKVAEGPVLTKHHSAKQPHRTPTGLLLS